MNKATIVENLKDQLREQYQRAMAAVQDAADGATGDDAKAESKYDTRGLESSYLAAGQVEQAERLARELQLVENFEFEPFSNRSKIDIGALVEADLDGTEVRYLLSPAGGGITITADDGMPITVIGGTAPLAGQLLDLTVGGQTEQPKVTVKSIG